MEDGLSDFKRWYFSKPLVTRTYLTGVFLLAAFVSMNIVGAHSLYYTFETGFLHLEIWRLFTAGFFLGKFSFNILFQMYFAYMFLNKTQTQLFSKQTYADFLWMMTCLVGALIVLSSIFPIYIYSNSLLMAITYIYCKRRPFEQFSLMFGFKVKSGYFPFVWGALKILLMGQSALPVLIGLALGHLYIFLKDILVVKTHKDYLATPQFLKRWWYKANNVPDNNQPSQNRANNPFAGQGVRIG